jgi:hypothetical protein
MRRILAHRCNGHTICRAACDGHFIIVRTVLFALAIVGCAHWQDVSLEEVRSGQASLDGKDVKVFTAERNLEIRVDRIEADAIYGRTLDGGSIAIRLVDVHALQVAAAPSHGTYALWTVLGVLVVGLLVAIVFLLRLDNAIGGIH